MRGRDGWAYRRSCFSGRAPAVVKVALAGSGMENACGSDGTERRAGARGQNRVAMVLPDVLGVDGMQDDALQFKTWSNAGKARTRWSM